MLCKPVNINIQRRWENEPYSSLYNGNMFLSTTWVSLMSHKNGKLFVPQLDQPINSSPDTDVKYTRK